jgi:uncharacterized protein (DUF1697 family)
MTTYIALLRAVNVGGHKPVPMSDLTRTARNWNTVLKLAAMADD